MPATVSLQSCADYDLALVRAAVRRALEGLPETAGLLRSGRRVMLKPNIVNPRGPESAICTHPLVLRAAAEVCHEAGCSILVADQPTYSLSGRPGAIFQPPGYVDACRGLPVEWAVAAAAGYREFPVPKPYHVRVAYLTRLLDEVDLVLNLPKLKTHMQTRFTCGVKNMFGLVAPRQRMDLHMLGGAPFSQALADTFGAYRPQLSLLDGVVAMEGSGPTRGTPRATGWIGASADAVALDAIAGCLCGFGPREVVTTTAAGAAGYGVAELTNIRVTGAELESLALRLRRAPSLQGRLPAWLGKLVRRMLYLRPRVADSRCTRCGACAAACPAECIAIEQRATIDRSRCLECFCCMEACPQDAISVEESALARLVS